MFVIGFSHMSPIFFEQLEKSDINPVLEMGYLEYFRAHSEHQAHGEENNQHDGPPDKIVKDSIDT